MTRGPTATVLVIFALSTFVMFWWGVIDEYEHSEGFHKYTTVIARGFGYTINYHMVLVLVFATRSFMTLLRRTPLNLVFPFDEAMPKFHVGVGIIIVISGALHGVFHVIPGVISNKWAPGFGGWTFSVTSGIALFTIFLVMYIFARESARRKAFERFYYIHIVGAILGMILLIVHAKLRGKLYTYKWVTAPLIVYAFDRIYRKGFESLVYTRASGTKMYSGNVFKLTVPKTFEYKAGQYAEIKVPSISKLQWHPFTIASAPHEKSITFYIKESGDWTSALKKKLEALENYGNLRTGEGLRIQFRGPYGAPAQHVGQFRSIVLISAGIGGTPFLSIVKDAVNAITKSVAEEVSRKECQSKMRKFVSPHSSVALGVAGPAPKYASPSGRPSRDHRDGFTSDSSDNIEAHDLLVSGQEGPSATSLSIADSVHQGESVQDLTHVGRSSVDIAKNRTREAFHKNDATYFQESDEDVRAYPGLDVLDEEPEFWINNVTRARHVVSGLIVSYIIHWMAIARLFLTMIAAATYLGLDFQDYRGFQVLPLGFQITDFILAFVIFAQAFTANLLDTWIKKKIFVFDTVVSLPVLIAPAVLHILFFLGVGSDVKSVYPAIFYYLMWPLTALVVLVRHFKVVGEYSLLALNRKSSYKDTRSLDFVYTTPTADSDQWLLDELSSVCSSEYFRLHRFLTREKPDVENQHTGIGRFVNNFGRPNWDEIFDKIACNTPSGSFVGIFFCGPKAMELMVREAATKATYQSRERAWRYRGVRDAESPLVAKGCSVRLVVKAENF